MTSLPAKQNRQGKRGFEMTLSQIKQSIKQEPLKTNHIYLGDCLEVLNGFPDESVNCCVTSPPYWGLRDYGVDGQAGLEKTPEEFVQRMVEIFREVRRVLKSDGTLWLNLGDSYSGSGRGNNPNGKQGTNKRTCFDPENSGYVPPGLKPKDLVGIPWMTAFALRADGWYLRQDIIWHKPNPMPESVRDRCTKAHEYIFLLSKSAKYYYDNEAIKEDAVDEESYKGRRFRAAKQIAIQNARPFHRPNTMDKGNEADGVKWEKVNKRSVWSVTVKPFNESHFATFPPDLIEPCVLAGCPENGIILDPFMGAGTTGLVAYKNKRDYIGIELNPEYREMAIRRIQKEQEKYGLLEGIA